MDTGEASNARVAVLDGKTSTESVLQAYSQFAIPHFQRGLVWDTGSVAALLESLFYGTPCGSIILWSPADAAEHGVWLGPTRPTSLIVDGQQRIRSLRRVFSESESDEADSDEGGDEDADADSGAPGAVWCLNLGRLSQFQEQFAGGRRFGLFRRARDPRTIVSDKPLCGAPRDDAAALVPLIWFLSLDDGAVKAALSSPEHAAIRDATSALLSNEDVNTRLRNITKQRVFSVTTLNASQSYQEVIAVYNRINSSGRRVEAEEKAYANLVGEWPDAEVELRRFFGALEHGRTHPGVDALVRDGLLQRQKENQFGFKLFMRSFVMALAYHSCRNIGAGSLSFDSANPESLRLAGSHLAELLKSNSEMLGYVESVVRDELHCDDLRFLPETASLWPVFQLLIRFPGLRQVAKLSVASIILRLMIANLEKRELLSLCRRLNEAHDGLQALKTLEIFESHLEAGKRIHAGVTNAQALTDRFVLMLYWLLRKRGALDFSYERNLTPAKVVALRKRYGTNAEPELHEALEAERQHLVPYRHLKEIFGLDGARPGRHAVNDIGNLTFISAGLNSFRTGVGDEPLNLKDEPKENLERHLLDDPDVLADYRRICEAGQGSEPAPRQTEKLYSRMCKNRRAQIAVAMVAREAELRSRAEAERPHAADVHPARHLIKPAPEDHLAGYAPELAKRLARLVQGGMRMNVRKAEAIALRHKPPRGKQLLRIDLAPDGAQIGFKLANHGFADAFARSFPAIKVDEKKNSKRCKLATDDPAGCARAAEVLDWVANAFG